jgi:hypothetical protein
METVGTAFCILTGLVKAVAKMKCQYSMMSGVCLPKKAGKTECVKALDSNTYMLLDLESSLRMSMTNEEISKLAVLYSNGESSSINSFYYPIAKAYVKKIRKDFPKKKLIVFSSDPCLLKYCGIKNIVYMSPSNKLFSTILTSAQPANSTLSAEEYKRVVSSSRDEIIKLSGDGLVCYNSFDQLHAYLVSTFGLRPKL